MTRFLLAGLLSALLVACHGGTVAIHGPRQPTPMAQMRLTIRLPATGGAFRAQQNDANTAQSVKVSVWGPYAMTPAVATVNLAPAGTTATVTVGAKAGMNRFVKAEAFAGPNGTGGRLQVLYGIGDLIHPNTSDVTVDWATTPTGYVMAMLAEVDQARTLATSRSAVQGLVDSLLAQAADANGAQLNPERLFNAIEAKTGATRPLPYDWQGWVIPAASDPLVADVFEPAARGEVRVWDLKGNLVTSGIVVQLHDPVTPAMTVFPYTFADAVPSFVATSTLFQAKNFDWAIPSTWQLSVSKPDGSRRHHRPVKLLPERAGFTHVGADSLNINLAGELDTAFGDGSAGAGLDQLNDPRQMVYDAAGNLYVADRGNHRILKISAGTATIIAGSGVAGGPAADGTDALTATFNHPEGVAIAPDGTLYIADTGNHLIYERKIDGTLYRVAGLASGVGGNGDDGLARSVALQGPKSLAYGGGRLYIHDSGNAKLRAVSSGHLVTLTIPASNGSLTPESPALAYNTVTEGGTVRAYLYYAKGGSPVLVRRAVEDSDLEAVVAGTGNSGISYPMDDGVNAVLTPMLQRVTAVAADDAGNVYFTDTFPDGVSGRIRMTNITHSPPRLFTVAGSVTGPNFTADQVHSTGEQATFGIAQGIAVKPIFGGAEPVLFTTGGNGTNNHRIRRLKP